MGDLSAIESKSFAKKFCVLAPAICDFCGYPIFNAPVVDRKAGYHRRQKGESIYIGQRARKTYHQGSCAFQVLGKKKRKYKESYKIAMERSKLQVILELVLRVIQAYPKLTKEQVVKKLASVRERRVIEALRMLRKGKLIKKKKGVYAENKVQETEGKESKAPKGSSSAKTKKTKESRTKRHL